MISLFLVLLPFDYIWCRPQVKLRNGGELLTRCFGRYNGSLWDDVFAEIGPLTENDVIIANFGAWYPRFSYHEIRVNALCISVSVSASFSCNNVAARNRCTAHPAIFNMTSINILMEV